MAVKKRLCSLSSMPPLVGRRIAHALQHQVQEHALELPRRLLHAALRILREPVAQVAGRGGVEHQALCCSIAGAFMIGGWLRSLDTAQLR
jgi:hypothetical protein